MDEFSGDEEGEELSDEDVPPQLVPLNVKTTPIKPKMFSGKHNKDIIEFAPESVADDEEEPEESSYHSSEMENLEEQLNDLDNPHGFVYAHNIVPAKLSKQDRLQAQEDGDKVEYEGKKRDRKSKNAGTTNKAKLRNKPFNMLLPKKVRND